MQSFSQNFQNVRGQSLVCHGPPVEGMGPRRPGPLARSVTQIFGPAHDCAKSGSCQIILAVLVAVLAFGVGTADAKVRVIRSAYVPIRTQTAVKQQVEQFAQHLVSDVDGVFGVSAPTLPSVCPKKRGRPFRCTVPLGVTTIAPGDGGAWVYGEIDCTLEVFAYKTAAWIPPSRSTCPQEWF